MKKLAVLTLLLMMGLSYGQAKKKNKSKKVVPTTVTLSQRVITNEDIKEGTTISEPTFPIEDNTIIYNPAGIEVQPEFPGGNTKLHDYLSKNFELSQNMKENELNGKVIASFVVEIDGSITNIKIIKDLGFETGVQAERVLKKMPRWIPGEQNGRKVRCSYVIPIMIYATKQ